MEDLFPGTWYLTRVDDKHRREYSRRPLDNDLPAEPELVRSSTAAEVQNEKNMRTEFPSLVTTVLLESL